MTGSAGPRTSSLAEHRSLSLHPLFRATASQAQLRTQCDGGQREAARLGGALVSAAEDAAALEAQVASLGARVRLRTACTW